MAVVAIIAINCAVIRFLLPGQATLQVSEICLAGLLPLANAALIAVYLLALRYRISLRRRSHRERIGMLPGFAIASSLALIVMIAVRVFAEEEVLQYLQFILRPVDVFLRSMGVSDRDYDGAVFRFVPMPLLLGASLSGPALLIALAVGWVSNRYRVMITQRNVRRERVETRERPSAPRANCILDSPK
jgi:hypothetical protein